MKYVKIMIIILVSLLVLLLAFLGFIYIKGPTIILNGDDNITINLNEEYKEIGYKVSYLVKNLDNKVKTSNNIDNTKLGEYEVTYKLKYKNKEYTKTRKVIVVDTEAPVINLENIDSSYACPNQEYVEQGYTITDNYDEDLTDKAEIIKNSDNWIYKVKDLSGNETTFTRNIIYQDNDNPVITLSGNETITIYKGNSYNELGFSASDNCDGDITDKVVVTNNVNTNTIGTYDVVYTVKDSSDNEVSITRKVNVIQKQVSNYNPVYSSKTIYLTFDDGPSANITPKILDILKEEGVKATFFVTDQGRGLDYLIKREYDEGHTVAIHTSTHNYKQIYASEEAFFNDLYNMGNIIKNVTEYAPKITRFPGGSSNTVSRFNPGIMTRLTREVTNRGYLYYDWSIDSEDAAGASQNKIYSNVTKNMGYYKTNIVLMHDSGAKVGTLNALRDIIRYGKEQGFTFDRITENTPQVKHGVNN